MPKHKPKRGSSRKREMAPVRRAIVRIFMKAFVAATQSFFVETQKLVPPDQKLPCDDEMLQYINVRTTVVSGNNPTGVVIQWGIAGPFAEDPSDFLPVSPPQTFSRSGKLFTHLAIPHITRQKKGVLSDTQNRIVVKVTAVKGQVDTAALVCNFTTGFKVPILEYHQEDVGTPHEYEKQQISGETPTSTPDAPDYIVDSVRFNFATLFAPITVGANSVVYEYRSVTDAYTFTVSNLTTGYTKNGVFQRNDINDLQGLYTAQGFEGNIQLTARKIHHNEVERDDIRPSPMQLMYNMVQRGDLECGALKATAESSGFELVQKLGQLGISLPGADTSRDQCALQGEVVL